jgi:AraC-like DNA-binding protein
MLIKIDFNIHREMLCMTTTLHLIRASHLNPILQYMNALSLPVELLLKQVGLNLEMLIEPNQLIIETKIWKLLELVAKEHHIEDFGTTCTENSHLEEYGELINLLLKANNLYQAMQLLIHKMNLHSSKSVMWLEESDGFIWLCYPQYLSNKNTYLQSEQHMMTFMCMIIEFYASSGWTPRVIKLQQGESKWCESSRFFKTAQIRLHHHYSAIAIEVELFKDRNMANEVVMPLTLKVIPKDFVQSFKLLLKQNYFGQAWLAENIAANLGMSVRTLKRKLQTQKTSLREVFDEVRFQQAQDLIEEGVCDYGLLADKLCYTHPNNFVRAFKRWSGITPREYIRLRNIELMKQRDH